MTHHQILVVEDDGLLRMTTVDLIAECGIEVLESDSGDNAKLIIAGHADDLAAVVTDVRMPGNVDGVELAQWIVGRWPHIRVLVTSGYTAGREADLPPGVQFMSKPWLPLNLIKFVQDAANA